MNSLGGRGIGDLHAHPLGAARFGHGTCPRRLQKWWVLGGVWRISPRIGRVLVYHLSLSYFFTAFIYHLATILGIPSFSLGHH